MMNRKTLIIPLVLLILLLTVSSTLALTNVTACGTLSASDTYVLQNNISSTASACFTITGSNIIFDGAGYTIDMTGGSSAIKLNWAVANTEIKNFNIKGDPTSGVGAVFFGGNNPGTNFHDNTVYGPNMALKLFQAGAFGTYHTNTFNGIVELRTWNSVTTALFYNNIMNGTIQDTSSSSIANAQWNTTQTLGTSIVGGNYIGGNHWPAYVGCTDTIFDNICDAPYATTASPNSLPLTDYLPLDIGNFCDPHWVCDSYGTCDVDTQTQPCNSVADTNLCFEPYTGNYSEFTEQDCYTPGAYEPNDIPSIIIDGIAYIGIALIGLLGAIILVVLYTWGRKKMKK